MQGVDHYENFPVASWLCPARLRPTIAALYHYARTADDIADEGDASADRRLTERPKRERRKGWCARPDSNRHAREGVRT